MLKKLAFLIVLASLLLAACGTAAPAATQAPAATDAPAAAATDAPAKVYTYADMTLCYPQLGAESDWRTANTASFKETAEQLGVNLVFSDAQQKQENQISAMRTCIQQGGGPPGIEHREHHRHTIRASICGIGRLVLWKQADRPSHGADGRITSPHRGGGWIGGVVIETRQLNVATQQIDC